MPFSERDKTWCFCTKIRYEELAYHYSRSQDVAKAIEYLQKAGEKAVKLCANKDAISYFTKGLELLGKLPDTIERIQQELSLQVALGAPLIATKGYAASEVGNAFNRAWELCQQLGNPPQLVPVLTILTAFYEMRAEYQKARQLGEICLNLAQNTEIRECIINCVSFLLVIK